MLSSHEPINCHVRTTCCNWICSYTMQNPLQCCEVFKLTKYFEYSNAPCFVSHKCETIFPNRTGTLRNVICSLFSSAPKWYGCFSKLTTRKIIRFMTKYDKNITHLRPSGSDPRMPTWYGTWTTHCYHLILLVNVMYMYSSIY